jgi:hypothetical protein
MDFLIGILLIILGILLVYNFTSISVSDSQFSSGSCGLSSNYIIAMQNGQYVLTPAPNSNSTLLSSAGIALSNSTNIPYSNNYNYDYGKYFFVS